MNRHFGPLFSLADRRALADPRVDLRIDRATAAAYEVKAGEFLQIIDVAGRAGVPDDAKGVVANLTAVRPSQRGFLTAHPCSEQRPLAAVVLSKAGWGDEPRPA